MVGASSRAHRMLGEADFDFCHADEQEPFLTSGVDCGMIFLRMMRRVMRPAWLSMIAGLQSILLAAQLASSTTLPDDDNDGRCRHVNAHSHAARQAGISRRRLKSVKISRTLRASRKAFESGRLH